MSVSTATNVRGTSSPPKITPQLENIIVTSRSLHRTSTDPVDSLAIMSFNGALNEPYPSGDLSTVSHVQQGFKISVRKLPISKSGPIDEMSQKLGIPVPEMIFGDNIVAVEHVGSGWRLEFNAFDALDRVDKTGKEMLKVAYSKEWSSSRYHWRS